MGKAFDVARGLLDAESAGVAGDSRLVEWRRGAQQWTEHFREELMTPAPGTVCGPVEYETDDSVLERQAKRASAKAKSKSPKAKEKTKTAKTKTAKAQSRAAKTATKATKKKATKKQSGVKKAASKKRR
jgi:hypothetical protein